MTTELPTPNPPDALLAHLRSMIPPRPLTYGQALVLAERQANRTRRLLGDAQAAFDLSWLFDHPDITIELRPEYRMPDHTSGATTKIDGRLVVFLNASESRPRQRFTLAHEFKHVLDFDLLDTTYRKLGRGNAELQATQIEWLCNRYAVCLLMPKLWVNRLWARGIQDVVALSHVFQVSVEAMSIRLETLGYGAPPQPPQSGVFFRRTIVPETMRRSTGTDCPATSQL